MNHTFRIEGSSIHVYMWNARFSPEGILLYTYTQRAREREREREREIVCVCVCQCVRVGTCVFE